MKRLLLTILRPHFLHWFFDLVTAMPRVFAGFWLATRFGWSKFPTPTWFIEDVGKLGFPAPIVFAWMAVLSEVVGGACMALGLGTRIAAFFVACTMLGALFLQKWDDSLWEKLPAAGFLWVAIYSLALGSGRFGLDFLITRMMGGSRASVKA